MSILSTSGRITISEVVFTRTLHLACLPQQPLLKTIPTKTMNYSKPHQVKPATGPILWYLNKCGFKGWTSFWNTIYVLPGYEKDEPLLRHERKHLEQIDREGKLKFSVKYLYWLLKYGYWQNPYEVEARQAEKQ